MWKKGLLEDSHGASCECDCGPHYVDGSNQWPLTTLNARWQNSSENAEHGAPLIYMEQDLGVRI